MRLERIRLKTFGCFQQQDFELSDGINLIFWPQLQWQKHACQRHLFHFNW